MSGSEWGEAPAHAILPGALRYRILALRIELEPEDGSEPFLDLTLQRGYEQRRLLRFWSPRELEIERGGPSGAGFQIDDLSSRGMQDNGVRVWDCEADRGSVSFVARRVEDLTKEPE